MADDQERRQTIDPSTAEILENIEQKRDEARLPRDERLKKVKARQKAKARLPGRVNWDLPPELKQRIFDLAKRNRIPSSQVAAFLLLDGLKRLEAGEIDFSPYKQPSTSPRYDWNLNLPESP